MLGDGRIDFGLDAETLKKLVKIEGTVVTHSGLDLFFEDDEIRGLFTASLGSALNAYRQSGNVVVPVVGKAREQFPSGLTVGKIIMRFADENEALAHPILNWAQLKK